MPKSRPRLIVLSDYGHVNGGATHVAITSACGLARRGWDLVFVCAVAPIAPELPAAGVDVRVLPVIDVWHERSHLRAARHAIWNNEAAAQVARILHERDIDETIVHIHQWTRALSPASVFVARASGSPVVVTLHDYFAACPNGLFFDYSTVQRCERSPLSLSCLACNCDRNGRTHKAVRVVRQVMTQRVWRREGSLTFVHTSAFARNRLQPLLPALSRHMVVHNPCFVERAPPVNVAANTSIVYLGRLTVEKGVRQLAEAARRAEVPLLIQGEGPLLQELESLGGNVTIRRWGDRSSVLQTLEEARVLAFPSLWDETSGLSACEALARGIPVIASRTTAAAELVEEGGGGLVVPTGDVEALCGAVRRLATGDAAARMGAAAYQAYWRAPRTLEHHVGSLEQVYADAFAANGIARPTLELVCG